MLSPYRVLDLTDHRGHFAGFILASLGAEVIAVEPPEGSAARRLKRLVAGADVLIESDSPGVLAALRLGYTDLAAVNPARKRSEHALFEHPALHLG